MKKALLLGDYRQARYHPLYGVDDVLRRVYDGAFEMCPFEDYGRLSLGQLKQYDLVINYADDWDGRGSRASAAALVTYVADGGSYLALHGGLVTKSSDELCLMTGARFAGHPSQILMDLRKGEAHAVNEWFEPFKITEEPYRFEFDVFSRRRVVLEYNYARAWYPAAWCHPYLLGKVFCAAPGHSPESFAPQYRKLLYKAGLWLSDRL